MYCVDCVQMLIDRQFDSYISALKGKSDCETGLKALLEIGPPIYFRDINPETGARFEVKEYIHDGKTYSGVSKTMLTWEELNSFAQEIKTSGDGWPEVLTKYGL